jgi:probable F420-dependent oxidoreductase
MQLGVFFPHFEFTKISAIRDFAIGIEELGFDHLVMSDHVLGISPEINQDYSYKNSFHEALITLSYMAAYTNRLKLVTGVLVLPQRQAVVVAKQVAQLDYFSGGRVRLGIGTGWNKPEIEAVGMDASNRGKRIEEQVEVMRRLWTQEAVNYDGAYHQLHDVGINPLPVQRPIPIWFGGSADVVLRRMARVGDGWLPGGPQPEKAKSLVIKLQDYLGQEGRESATFGIEPFLSLSRLEENEQQRFIKDWQDLGATGFIVTQKTYELNATDERLEELRQFIRSVK